MPAEVGMDGAKGRTPKFEHGRGARGSQVQVTVVERVFGSAVGQLAVLVLHQHVGFRDGEGTF